MRQLEQLLVDALNPTIPLEVERLAALTPTQWQELVMLAASQRVRPLLWHRLKQKEMTELLPADVVAWLRESFRQNSMRNMRYHQELRRLLSALQTEHINLILLKGIYLADAVYGNLGLREMNDIDLLARPADLARIADILAGMGYASPQPICPEITVKTSHHLPRMIKEGFAAFEIHWNLVSPEESCRIDPDELWERSVPTQKAGCPALALAPEDLLLHLCLHTSYQHQFAFGLRPFCDIAATIGHFGAALDWQAVLDQTCCREWQRGVYLALRLARDLVGAAVPDAVLARLMPSDLSPAVLDTVRAQIFCDKSVAASIPESFAALLESSCLADKIRIFWQRVFLPRVMLAAIYSVPPESVKIYGCYPRRIFNLLCRYGPVLKKYQRNEDVCLRAIVARQNLIAAWLAGSVDAYSPFPASIDPVPGR